MKKVNVIAAFLIVLGFAASAPAVDFTFHGLMDHRFLLYTNHQDWLQPGEQRGEINGENVEDFYGEFRYRLWFEAASDDHNIKGVYAIEAGTTRFGRPGSGKSEGGAFSGDGVNLETRWAYIDFQLPGIESKARSWVGLQPFSVNKYVWKETAAGINFYASPGAFDYQLAWMRGYDDLRKNPDNKIRDVDGFLGRITLKPKDGLKIGLFGLYQTGDADAKDASEFGSFDSRDYLLKKFAQNVKLGIGTIGIDGGYDFAPFFLNWDGMYQYGSIDEVNFTDFASKKSSSGDFDLSAYFFHTDLGVKRGPATLKYTFWYASGDDDPEDNDFNGFLSTDVDIGDSIAFQEGVYTDYSSFSERPYMLDKGFIMNRLGLDYRMTDKLTLGGAMMYMMTAEDIKYTAAATNLPQSNSDLGFETDAYLSYKLYKNLVFKINAGYLFAGDAMDAFEVDDIQDGSSDENIFASSARILFTF